MDKTEVTSRLNEALRAAFSTRGIQLKSDMAKMLGYKSPYFSGITTGKEKLTNAFLMTLTKKLGINSEWILHGVGSMMLPNPEEDKVAGSLVPLIPVSAHAGSLSIFSEQVKLNECEKIISPVEGADFAITIAGDSMAPEYPNGAILLIKKINEKAFIEWGKAYVLDTRNGIVVKVLVPGQRDGRVKCVSINKDPIFAPFEIAKDDIFGIYAVKFCMARK